jgi:hypothetical protein
MAVYEFDNMKIKNRLKFSDMYVGKVGEMMFTSTAPSEVLNKCHWPDILIAIVKWFHNFVSLQNTWMSWCSL